MTVFLETRSHRIFKPMDTELNRKFFSLLFPSDFKSKLGLFIYTDNEFHTCLSIYQYFIAIGNVNIYEMCELGFKVLSGHSKSLPPTLYLIYQ